MSQLRMISLFQGIIIVLLLLLIPFVLQEAAQFRSTSFSHSYGLEILPQLMAFGIGILLAPKKTEKILAKSFNLQWTTLVIGGIIFIVAWVPFIYWLDTLSFILPTAFFSHLHEVRFIVLLLGGMAMMKGLVQDN